MNENKDLLSCGNHLVSCYHKLVSHSYDLALELVSKWWEQFLSGGKKIISGWSEIVSGGNKLVSGGDKLVSGGNDLISGGVYVAFNTLQVRSQQAVGRAEETSTYSGSRFCTVNCQPTASNYQLSLLRPGWELNPSLRGGRREC